MKTINTQSQFDDYLQGVQERADHHSPNVKKIIPILADEVLKVYPLENGIDVRTYKGRTANIAWINGPHGRIAFTYCHNTDVIKIRKKTLNGKVKKVFQNSSTKSDITEFLEKALCVLNK